MRAVGIFLATLVLSAIAEENGHQPSIHGMQGLRINCKNEGQLNLVRSYANKRGFDFLRLQRDWNKPVDILVAYEQLEHFKQDLVANEISYNVFIEDVGRVVKEQQAEQRLARRLGSSDDILKTFPRYEEITAYLKNLARTHSDIVTLLNFGKTYEGRDILGVKISTGGSNKSAVLFDAGVHAREWIAPTTVIYAIKQLAENATNRYVFENVDVYVIPSINPDGYEYSHKGSNRMWRKNRSKLSLSDCVGTDINRNFAYDWSWGSDPCSITYGGPKPFSEIESNVLKDFVLANKDRLKVYIGFHSYGNYFLHPWGAKKELPKNAPKLECAAAAAEKELSKIRGTHYQIGSSYNLLYPVYGGSKDWILGTAGIELAYTVELPSGQYGFLAPVSEIIPVGRETFEAIKIFVKYAEGKICRDV